MINKNLKILCH